jgi:hypothetical protein
VRWTGSKLSLELPVTELERTLIELGRTLQAAEPPPVTRRVSADLRRHGAPHRRLRIRSSAAVALATTVAAAVAAMAVPSARTSLARFFHLGGVTIERVDELPGVKPRGPLAPGKEVGWKRARASVSFMVLVPRNDPTPSHAFYYAADPPGGQLTLVYGGLREPRLLVTEVLGTKAGGALSKEASPSTVVEHVDVDGHPGIWLGGAKHVFTFVDGAGTTRAFKTRLAGNTLVWEQAGITLRLEADIDRGAAIKLAESFIASK